MNNFVFEGSWNQMKGKLRQKYAQLTDDDLNFVEGKGEELLGRLQTKLGLNQHDLSAVLNDIKASLDENNGGVREMVGQMKVKAAHFADDMKAAASSKAGELKSQAKTKARTIHEDAEEYVRQKPREALLTALAAGFVVGLLFRR